jgi:ABC-type hemin transport system substrate-binding protein
MNQPHRTLTDARGRQLPAAPRRRVVSLVPSLTETVCGLGAGGLLVGRTMYCCEPREELAAVPAFGGTKNPDLAAILALSPDLVLACAEENKPEHLAQLEAAGTAVHTVMPRSLDDVASLLADYGALLDAQPAAGRALSELTAARLAAGAWRARLGEPLPAACLVWRKPWLAAGGGNHITAMMREAGLENVLAGREGYPEVKLDELAALQPAVVLLPDEPYPFTHHAAWSLAAAGVVPTRRRAVLLDGKVVCWYGTRTAGALRELVRVLESRLISAAGSTAGPPPCTR